MNIYTFKNKPKKDLFKDAFLKKPSSQFQKKAKEMNDQLSEVLNKFIY